MQYQTTCKTPASSHMDHLDRVVLVSTQKRIGLILYYINLNQVMDQQVKKAMQIIRMCMYHQKPLQDNQQKYKAQIILPLHTMAFL